MPTLPCWKLPASRMPRYLRKTRVPPQPTASADAAAAAAAAASSAAAAYQRSQSAVADAAALAAIREWRQIDGKNLDLSWLRIVARLLTITGAAQVKAADAAMSYLGRILKLQAAEPSGVRLSGDAFRQLTGDGRPMGTLLYSPVARTKALLSGGTRIADAIAAEEAHMAMLVRTQVQDAGRMALQSAMAAEPKIRGYVRKVNLPACARCIILSGAFYRYSTGFARHPNCDCTMIPAVGEEWTETEDPAALLRKMQDDHPKSLKKSLTEGDLKAIERGADVNQVVNAHRGMATPTAYGRKVNLTTEGTTKRGIAGRRLIAEGGSKSGGRYRSARTPRLSPAQIFEEASRNSWGRDEIVRQLTRFGYII
jgi:hypothetical protein